MIWRFNCQFIQATHMSKMSNKKQHMTSQWAHAIRNRWRRSMCKCKRFPFFSKFKSFKTNRITNYYVNGKKVISHMFHWQKQLRASTSQRWLRLLIKLKIGERKKFHTFIWSFWNIGMNYASTENNDEHVFGFYLWRHALDLLFCCRLFNWFKVIAFLTLSRHAHRLKVGRKSLKMAQVEGKKSQVEPANVKKYPI